MVGKSVIAFCYSNSRPTVCVREAWQVGGRGQGLGAEKTRSQKNACKSRRLPHVHCTSVGWDILFHQRNSAQREYTAKWQTHKPYTAVETRHVAVPRCTLVSDPNDLSTGGVGWSSGSRPNDPDYAKRLYNPSDRVCQWTNDEQSWASFWKAVATLFCG